MKKVVLVLFAVFMLGLWFRPAFGDEVKVLAPAAGQYTVGNPMTIKWDYTFLGWTPSTASEKRMQIDLLYYVMTGGGGHGGGTQWTLDRTIAVVDVYTTSYAWMVVNSPGDNRVIRITMLEKPFLTAMSSPFTIKGLTAGMQPKVPYKLGIKITSPEAGKTYYIGDTVPILWEKTVIPEGGTVWLQVCYPDHTTCGGSFPVANSGIFSWTISEAEEHDLCIKITSHDDQHTGYSGVFHVGKKLNREFHPGSATLKLK